MALQVVEFRAVVGGKEHVVAQQRKAACGRDQIPGHRRQRARGRLDGGRRAAHVVTEVAGRQRGDVGVGNHGARRQPLARGQSYTGDVIALQRDLADVLAVAELHAVTHAQCRQRLGQPVHAALDQPYAALFDVGHQHQGGRCIEGRRAAIGGVAAEQLAQPRVAEVAAERLPHRRKGAYAQDVDAGAARQFEWPWPLGAHEAAVERAVDGLRLARETDEAPRLGGAGEVADGLGTAVDVGMQIQVLAGRPGVARQHFDLARADVRGEVAAGGVEDVLEYLAQRKHRRAGVEPQTGHVHLAQLAAGRACALGQRHRQAAAGQFERGYQARHAGTDHHHVLSAHAGSCKPSLTLRPVMSTLHYTSA